MECINPWYRYSIHCRPSSCAHTMRLVPEKSCTNKPREKRHAKKKTKSCTCVNEQRKSEASECVRCRSPTSSSVLSLLSMLSCCCMKMTFANVTTINKDCQKENVCVFFFCDQNLYSLFMWRCIAMFKMHKCQVNACRCKNKHVLFSPRTETKMTYIIFRETQKYKPSHDNGQAMWSNARQSHSSPSEWVRFLFLSFFFFFVLFSLFHSLFDWQQPLKSTSSYSIWFCFHSYWMCGAYALLSLHCDDENHPRLPSAPNYCVWEKFFVRTLFRFTFPRFSVQLHNIYDYTEREHLFFLADCISLWIFFFFFLSSFSSLRKPSFVRCVTYSSFVII